MKAIVKISNYIDGRYNGKKLIELKEALQTAFEKHETRAHQSISEKGIEVKIGMSAKYQTPYVTCEGWGEYKSIGEFEDIIKYALDSCGLEATEEGDDENCLKISFE